MEGLNGRVALVTGAARGQGRSHAVTLARAGVNIALFDICHQITSVPYGLASADDLAETADMVREAGAEALILSGDVRRLADLEDAVARTVRDLGGLHFLVANAGIWSYGGATHEISELQWSEMIDVNLTGVWNSMRAALSHMVGQKFGRIVATSSMSVRGGAAHLAHYSAAKAGVVSLTKSVGLEYAEQGITCNVVLPTNVNTPMIRNEFMYQLMAGGGYGETSTEEVSAEAATVEAAMPGYASLMAMPTPWVEPEDVSAAVAYLLSDSARYITGVELPVNGGYDRGMG